MADGRDSFDALTETPAVRRGPLAELLLLALPTVAQMASYTVMQFIDTWILSRGESVAAPTAAANAGMLAFAVVSLGMGVMFVVNTLVSQSFGRNDFEACGRYLWQGVWVSVGFSVLVLPVLPYVSWLFTIVGHEPDVVRMETVYLQIAVGASVLKLVATAFAQFLLAVDQPTAVAASTVLGVAVNAVAAWGLVLGNLGMPRLGVAGAAWAQNIGVFVEMATLIGFALLPAVRNTFGVLRQWRFQPGEAKTLLRVGAPSGVQIVADVLAWSAFQMGVMAVFSTSAMAANIFVFRYMAVSFMPAFGISVAVTALVGRYIGQGNPDIARRRANLGFVVTLVYMVSCGLVFLVARRVLIGLFTTDPQVLATGATLLIFAAIYQCFDAMYIVYNGALRGAGDTFVPAVATATLNWSITVGGGYAIATLLPALGPVGPWYSAMAYGCLLGIFMLTRFQRGRWQAIHLEPAPAADRVHGFDALPAKAS